MRARSQVSYNHLYQVILCGDSFQSRVEDYAEVQKQLRSRPQRHWRRDKAKKYRKFKG